jgi:LPXTG-motif cell wall-anchored protein
MTVAVDAIVNIRTHAPEGHGTHVGAGVYPIRPWGDIIPPFYYTDYYGNVVHFPGLNYTADGAAILANGCSVDFEEVEPPPTTPPPTTPEETPTTPPPTTPEETPTTPEETPTGEPVTTPPATEEPEPPGETLPPGETVPPSENPGVEPEPGQTAEVEEPVTDPPNGAESLPPIEAVVPGPGGDVDLGVLSPEENRGLEAAVDAGVPIGAPPAGFGGASTGHGLSQGWLGAGGAFLALSGLASFAFWRRRRSA